MFSNVRLEGLFFIFVFLHGVPCFWVTFTTYLCLLEKFPYEGKRMGPQLVPPLACFVQEISQWLCSAPRLLHRRCFFKQHILTLVQRKPRGFSLTTPLSAQPSFNWLSNLLKSGHCHFPEAPQLSPGELVTPDSWEHLSGAAESCHPPNEASGVAAGLEMPSGVWSQRKGNRQGKTTGGEVDGQEEKDLWIMGSICFRCHFESITPPPTLFC